MARRSSVVSLRLPAGFAAFAALLAGPGCGGSSGDHADPVSVVTASIGDSPSADVTSLTVQVTDLSITMQGGVTPVSMLDAPATIDLATLSDLSQVLKLKQVAPGVYDTASITFDFTNARCFLRGKTVAAALLDSLGAPLTGTRTIALDLTAAPLNALQNNHHNVDFDVVLDQSLIIDLAGNSAIFEPTIVVRVDRSDGRPLLVFGQTITVTPVSNFSAIDLQTFVQESLGETLLSFDANTVFQIDGVGSTGAAGVAALAAEPAGTFVQAIGVIKPGASFLSISSLEAGRGTFGGGEDIVDGFVVDRPLTPGTDGPIVVFGSSSDAAHTTFQFNTLFTINGAFGSARVIRSGETTPRTLDTVNVGQHVTAFGALTGTTLDATAPQSVFREIPTAFTGVAAGAPVGVVLTLDLKRVGPVDPIAFNWANAGTAPATDPHAFTIDIGSLGDSLTIGSGTLLRAFAFVAAVDDPNFDAKAIALEDRTGTPTELVLHDRAAGFVVVTTAATGAISFNVTGTEGTDEQATLEDEVNGVQPLPLTPDPQIVGGAGPLVLTLLHLATGTRESFTVFDDLVTALSTALAGTETVRDVVATGDYDVVTNVLTASDVTIVLQ